MSQNVTRTYYDCRNKESFSATYERATKNGTEGWGRSWQTPNFGMACAEQEIKTLWEPDPAEPLVPADITNMTQCTIHTDGSVTWVEHIALPDGTFLPTKTCHSVISRGAERHNGVDEAGPGERWVKPSGGREGSSNPAVPTTNKTSTEEDTDKSHEAEVFRTEHRQVQDDEPGQTSLVPFSQVGQTGVGTQTDPAPSDYTPPGDGSKLIGHPELESWVIASGSSADESSTSPAPVPNWWETTFRSIFSRGSKGE
ncbi:hypothetical protein I204_07907 [Kwoniella mangroviensis CBS 8886]|nr:hypothetical protein I204_07907 [Kwoniella mangroviensis CBS 8886]